MCPHVRFRQNSCHRPLTPLPSDQRATTLAPSLSATEEAAAPHRIAAAPHRISLSLEELPSQTVQSPALLLLVKETHAHTARSLSATLSLSATEDALTHAASTMAQFAQQRTETLFQGYSESHPDDDDTNVSDDCNNYVPCSSPIVRTTTNLMLSHLDLEYKGKNTKVP